MTSKKKPGPTARTPSRAPDPRRRREGRPSASTRSRTGYYLSKPIFRMRKGRLDVV